MRRVFIHVYPEGDFREHDTDHPEGECWCRPEHDDGMVIHNAMDGREKFEEGTRLVS